MGLDVCPGAMQGIGDYMSAILLDYNKNDSVGYCFALDNAGVPADIRPSVTAGSSTIPSSVCSKLIQQVISILLHRRQPSCA